MPVTALTGSRLRERRLALGRRRAEVARAAGISASYLNLIEHNRRRVVPEALAALAGALGVEVEALAGGAEAALVADLRAAAAGAQGLPPEADRVEDLIARFPGWAELVAAQHRRLEQAERALAALSDRLTHDPYLSAALHEVLNAASSVRSTAAILAETEDLPADWRARFHGNLQADSERLAAGAEALVAYLDRTEAGEEAAAAPQEEVEAWLAARGWQLEGAGTAEGARALRQEAGRLASHAARAMAEDWIARAGAEANVLPAPEFDRALAAAGGDPGRIAAEFAADPVAVMRRIALWPGARAGLVVCDGSGRLVFRKPVEGFVLPRHGAACALWPLYSALTRPMTPVQAVVEMAGRVPRRFAVQAIAVVRHPQGFAGPQVVEAAMLVEPADPGAGPGLPVGPTCRICPRGDCPARAEPSLVSG